MADDLARYRESRAAEANRAQALYQQNWATVDEVVREFWSTVRRMNIPPQHVVLGSTDRGTGWELSGALDRDPLNSLMVYKDGGWTLDRVYGAQDMGPDLHLGSSDEGVVRWNSPIGRARLHSALVARLAELEDQNPGQAASPGHSRDGLGTLGNSLGSDALGSLGNSPGSRGLGPPGLNDPPSLGPLR
ncbi:hypothetical protein [Nocardia salmonicida]|uniref:hypothetical protein n=1 Tax=Nocardia salmonicida TaxID=53431 RepID=UPI002E2DCA2E|nr:hypothetical protein [Nocardia salmonicida]